MVKTKAQIFWSSEVPSNCDTCGTKITDVFYDAKTYGGPCATMCPSCHYLGPGIGKLGLGIGQEYTRQSNGKYLKTAG